MPVNTGVEKQQGHRQTLFLVLTLAGLQTENDSTRDQILASPQFLHSMNYSLASFVLRQLLVTKSFHHPLLTPRFSHLKPLKSVHISQRKISEGEDVLDNLNSSVVIVISLNTLVTYVIFCMVHYPAMILLF